MEKYWYYLMLLGIALSQAREGEALKCWKCNPKSEACGDPFKPREHAEGTYHLEQCHDGLLGFLKPSCFKAVTKIGDFVVRGCTNWGLDWLVDDFGYLSLCETCEEDGCNSAARLSAVGLLFTALTVATFHSLKV